MRSLPAQRLLASYAQTQGISFSEKQADGEAVPVDAIVALSPAGFLPAVIAFARSVAINAFGPDGDRILDTRCRANVDTALGVLANVSAMDSSPAGLLRGLILSRGFDLLCESFAVNGKLDVDNITEAFSSDFGSRCLLGIDMLQISVPNEMIGDVTEFASQNKHL